MLYKAFLIRYVFFFYIIYKEESDNISGYLLYSALIWFKSVSLNIQSVYRDRRLHGTCFKKGEKQYFTKVFIRILFKLFGKRNCQNTFLLKIYDFRLFALSIWCIV